MDIIALLLAYCAIIALISGHSIAAVLFALLAVCTGK
jgi:hypothetical protein